MCTQDKTLALSPHRGSVELSCCVAVGAAVGLLSLSPKETKTQKKILNAKLCSSWCWTSISCSGLCLL